MFLRSFRIFLLALLVLTGGIYCFGQSADNKTNITSKPGDDDEDRPKSFKETMEKLRIEKEKKEFDEMIKRGEEALKISEELETAFTKNGRLSDKELAKLATVEKLVKKVRSELGGDDDDNDDDKAEIASMQNQKISAGDAIKSLRDTTVRFFDELKKTTRFSISAAAIQTSNAVLKIARFLRIAN